MLNADNLGEKGQARFREICADAGLVCNQSDRDRTGWDFIVEFPFAPAQGGQVSLETRKTPLSCHVQVKTLLEKNDQFQMRLSSAERLAKELKPAFVYIFKVDAALQITGAHLIHILDEPLAKILKRLRKEDADGNFAPNHKKISMSGSRDGTSIAPTGYALRNALEHFCKTDLHSYAKRKAEQLAEIGFAERPYELKAVLHAGSTDDLVDTFLGLKKNIPASNVSTAQTRFGIKLPLSSLSDAKATVSIQPLPADTCTITVRNDQLSVPAVFKGTVFVPGIPNLPSEYLKFLIETELFSLVISPSGCRIETRANISPQSPSVWAAFWRLAFVMAQGAGSIQIASDKHRINPTIDFTGKTDALEPHQYARMIALCEQVSFLLKSVGAIDEPKLSMEAIVVEASRVSSAYALHHPEKGTAPFSFATEYAETLLSSLSVDMLYVDFLVLGDVILAYYGMAHVVGTKGDDRIEWKADNVTLARMVRLHHLPEEYAQLIETARSETGCSSVCARPFEETSEDT